MSENGTACEAEPDPQELVKPYSSRSNIDGEVNREGGEHDLRVDLRLADRSIKVVVETDNPCDSVHESENAERTSNSLPFRREKRGSRRVADKEETDTGRKRDHAYQHRGSLEGIHQLDPIRLKSRKGAEKNRLQWANQSRE